MSAVDVSVRVGISLELGCCRDVDQGLFLQMSSGKYGECSVLAIPDTIEDWEAARETGRKRSWRAERRGYYGAVLHRENHADDIYAINTSASHRQGRPMTAGYLERQEFSPLPVYRCGRHAIRTTGVFHGRRCLAYLVMHRAGELALVSQILGHDDYLDDGIMYLLFRTALEREIDHGPGMVVYNRHDSGTEGLRFYKERCGFSEAGVEWLP